MQKLAEDPDRKRGYAYAKNSSRQKKSSLSLYAVIGEVITLKSF